jgi:hypothetical protein
MAVSSLAQARTLTALATPPKGRTKPLVFERKAEITPSATCSSILASVAGIVFGAENQLVL